MNRGKSLYFASVGMFACIIGALIGEIFLWLTEVPKKELPPQPLDIVLLIDTSGSMQGSPIKQVKNSLKKVLSEKPDGDRIALVTFADEAEIVSDLTDNPQTFLDNIDKLEGSGLTNLNEGMVQAGKLLTKSTARGKCILIFSDGQPTCRPILPVRTAKILKRKNITLMSIAYGTIDIEYLKKIVGKQNIIDARNGNIFDAFKRAMVIITGNRQMISSAVSDSYSYGMILFRSIGWSVILSLATVFALIMAQNRIYGNRLISLESALKIGIFVPISAGASVACGEFIYSFAENNIFFLQKAFIFIFAMIIIIACTYIFKSEERKGIYILSIIIAIAGICFCLSDFFLSDGNGIFRCLGWGIWISILTMCVGLMIPNFDRNNACWAGFVGGIVACLLFLTASNGKSDFISHLLGAATLGATIGILMGILRKSGIKVEIYDEYTGTTYMVDVGEETSIVAGKNGALYCKVDDDGNVLVSDGEETKVLKNTKNDASRLIEYSGSDKTSIGRFTIKG